MTHIGFFRSSGYVGVAVLLHCASAFAEAPAAAPSTPPAPPPSSSNATAAPPAPAAAPAPPATTPAGASPSAAPASAAPASPAPATTEVPVPPDAKPPAPAPPTQPAKSDRPEDRVWVHFGANYQDAVLEGRSIVEGGAWQALCTQPCKQSLDGSGLEVRVSAPGMTTSNPFLLESGRGRVQFRVSGGSDTIKTIGIVQLLAGIPVAMAGMTMLGYGVLKDKDTLRDVGAVTLGVGAVSILASLPMLLIGTTRVYNTKSTRIANLSQFRF